METKAKPLGFKLALQEIENGYIITRPGGTVYREYLREALMEVRISVDQMAKEAKIEVTIPPPGPKGSTVGPQK